MKYDRERVVAIIDKMLDDARRRGIYQTDECINELEKLIGDVRSEAVAHTWTTACSTYDKGHDPRNMSVPSLVAQAIADLNPERE